MDAEEIRKLFKRVSEGTPAPRSGLEPIPAEERPCTDNSHFPPNFILIPYGMQYRHRCPSCGHESVIRSSEVRFSA